jgi:hypothetical protein
MHGMAPGPSGELSSSDMTLVRNAIADGCTWIDVPSRISLLPDSAQEHEREHFATINSILGREYYRISLTGNPAQKDHALTNAHAVFERLRGDANIVLLGLMCRHSETRGSSSVSAAPPMFNDWAITEEDRQYRDEFARKDLDRRRTRDREYIQNLMRQWLAGEAIEESSFDKVEPIVVQEARDQLSRSINAWRRRVANIAPDIVATNAHFVASLPLETIHKSDDLSIRCMRGLVASEKVDVSQIVSMDKRFPGLAAKATERQEHALRSQRQMLEDIALNPWQIGRANVCDVLVKLAMVYQGGIGGPAYPEHATNILKSVFNQDFVKNIHDQDYDRARVRLARVYMSEHNAETAYELIAQTNPTLLSVDDKSVFDYILGTKKQGEYISRIKGLHDMLRPTDPGCCWICCCPCFSTYTAFYGTKQVKTWLAKRKANACLQRAIDGTGTTPTEKACTRVLLSELAADDATKRELLDAAVNQLIHDPAESEKAAHVATDLASMLRVGCGGPIDKKRARDVLVATEAQWSSFAPLRQCEVYANLALVCADSADPADYERVKVALNTKIPELCGGYRTFSAWFWDWRAWWLIDDALGCGKLGTSTANYAQARMFLEKYVYELSFKKSLTRMIKNKASLAQLYCQGLGGAQELEKARPLLESIILNTSEWQSWWPAGFYYLAYCYQNGVGGVQDSDKARDIMVRHIIPVMKQWDSLDEQRQTQWQVPTPAAVRRKSGQDTLSPKLINDLWHEINGTTERELLLPGKFSWD